MTKEQVKRQVAKRKIYKHLPEKVRKEVGRFALVNRTKAATNRYSKLYPKYDLKRTSVNT